MTGMKAWKIVYRTRNGGFREGKKVYPTLAEAREAFKGQERAKFIDVVVFLLGRFRRAYEPVR